MAKKTVKEKLICAACQKEKDKNSGFYNSRSKLYEKIGKVPICKTCLKKSINYDDMESVYTVLQQMDVKFDPLYWEQAVQRDTDTFSAYMTMANSLRQFNGTGWKDSIFESDTASNTDDKIEEKNNALDKSEISDELIDKWGIGYTTDEYRQFERKYNKLIRNYGEKTALHTEGLLSYIRFRVKEELATAKGQVKEAKEWGSMASKAATDAKINVSQLSKSDISGGVDVLSQLCEAVETELGIIPLLPRLTAQPYDDADLIIWAIINYYRRLEDKEKVSYKDIYKFYDEMLEEDFKSKGLSSEEIDKLKKARNNVFRDLEDVYKEPLYDTGDEN
ncbi:hypothetical protein AB684_11585 [Bacillus licheniformis]|uniref:hypothetical protein n=1 Tax=Bacillus TaxID=1386 RepID=UPI00030A2DEE|nr:MULTISPECIES: hypothetical protein [Bacillus]AMR10794.1 hypothetical protein AB684_11585 [Bacillus licheniformis]KJH58687.1 hypothetical protein UF14_09755 [Bacillus licheniformis]KYC83495.1 hypothetical protein B4091_2073 [Bacillus licheniformis]MCM3374207.1 hypothetical protein [Bacillus licheniformis]MCM3433628.1 hypothetical protein [Bacillus licheniformis]